MFIYKNIISHWQSYYICPQFKSLIKAYSDVELRMVCFKNIVKCTILGDGMVGKTCLSKTFVEDQFPDRYVATVTGNYTGSVAAYGDQYTVDIRDTNGQVSIYWYAFY